MREKLSAREQKLKRIEEAIRSRKENIIYVDLVFSSMRKAIAEWYDQYYQRDDPHGYARNGHLFLLERFYNWQNFQDHDTVGPNRDALLIQLDDEMQLRRID